MVLLLCCRSIAVMMMLQIHCILVVDPLSWRKSNKIALNCDVKLNCMLNSGLQGTFHKWCTQNFLILSMIIKYISFRPTLGYTSKKRNRNVNFSTFFGLQRENKHDGGFYRLITRSINIVVNFIVRKILCTHNIVDYNKGNFKIGQWSSILEKYPILKS